MVFQRGTWAIKPSSNFQSDTLLAVESNRSGEAQLTIAKKGRFFRRIDDIWGGNVHPPGYYNRSEMEIVEIKENSPEKILKSWVLKPPSDCDSGWVAVSPNGDLLLWVMKQTRYKGLDSLLHRLFPKLTLHSTLTSTWKVSKLDGSELREIAHYPLMPVSNKAAKPEPFPVWMPGGKSVSVQKDDMLYVVPVE